MHWRRSSLLDRAAAAFGAVALVATLTAGLAGCNKPEPMMCVSWADLSDPSDAFESATLVVVGTLAPTGTTVRLYGEAAAAYDVEVSRVLKGKAPDPLTVVSTPPTCSGGEVYPDGDPLDTGDETVLFLNNGGDLEINRTGAWHTISPYGGARPVSQVPDGDSPTLEEFLGE